MNIQELFKKHKIRPKRSLGQNFLIDNSVIKKIIREANMGKNDSVLEIGPGLGALTKELAKNTKNIVAVEKDENLYKILKQELINCSNVKIVNADILKYMAHDAKYKIIANLPYNIASAVIRKFLEAENKPEEMVVMLQKEVAQRIVAQPPDMSVLAASVQFYADPKILFYVSRNSFLPKPKVDSAIIKITPHNKIDRPGLSTKFFRTVKAGFSSPRKQLINNLSSCLKIKKAAAAEWLKKNNIDPIRRAETLSVEEWKNLAVNMPDF